jgi:NADH-quinone oxidoreductase subunit I
MYIGLYVLKSFAITIYRFIETYLDDVKWFFKGGFGKRYSPEALPIRQGVNGRGIFVVQYPVEHLPLPERYRGSPFLVYKDDEPDKLCCTACGMCARVCPPQCIWIKRGTDPATGKPLRQPAEFHIDRGICMHCGFCAEFCSFGAIKMGHDLEDVAFAGGDGFLWGIDQLRQPASYDAQIHPTDYASEQVEKESP